MKQIENSRNLPDAQIDRFRQAARDAECNEDEEAFKLSLRAIAKAPVEKGAKGK